jgi:hypothetical protein
LQLRYASLKGCFQRLFESRLGRGLLHDVSYHDKESPEDKDDQQILSIN